MSHRIFVNTQNQSYKSVTDNGTDIKLGLGVPTILSEEESIDLLQTVYEVYFSSDDLREKRRKIQIVFDSLTDPMIFSDGALKPDKVEKYIQEFKLQFEEAERQNQLASNTFNATNFVGGVIGTFAGSAAISTALNLGAAMYGLGAGLGGTALTVGAYVGLATGFIAPLVAVFNIAAAARQAGREDNKAPWKMTRADFPNITAQAIQGSPTRRSLERLYDSRNQLDVTRNVKQVSTEEAVALLVRECLADALFCRTVPNGTASTPSQHPGPGGNGDATGWKSKDSLKNHFGFKHITTGPDRLERTYVNALIYLQAHISLITAILNLQNSALSRSPDVEEAVISIPIKISLSTAIVPLFNAVANTALQVIREKVVTFFDEEREYKTLLNLGDDRQYVAEAWRLAPKDTGSIQLKLLQPISEDIIVDSPAFISREIAQSVVDIVELELSPEEDTTPYLRPYNMDVGNYVDSKMLASNVTLTSLGLATASAGTIVSGSTVSYGDSVFRRWFTGDFKSSELNIDFTNYNNFVHFGSAYKRLEAFKEKLIKIEELTSASISSSVSSSLVSLMLTAQEKENVIRNFDSYEQFLYYVTESIVYSASAFYVTDEVEYNATGSWPKLVDGTPRSPYDAIAINWLEKQSGIAQRYDDNNPNYLILNLPKHIQEDTDSRDFLTLFEMVGHMMDNIKVYIDQFPNIYSTNINPLEELSMDQVYEVAQSFGLQLPNVYALENLQAFNAKFSGDTGTRSYVTETWKRFLHSLIYFAKIKGSRTSLDALLNTYGINSPVLQIKETTYPGPNNYIRSDELTYGLRFTSSINNFITVPFVSSSIVASTLQVSFKPILTQPSSLVTSTTWAIDLVPHPSSSKMDYGRIEIVSGSSRTKIASSSYFQLFGEDYTHIMLRSQSTDLTIIQTDGEQILFKETRSVDLSSLWNSTQFIYFGGSGSIKLTNNFDGIVDEIRIWGENISDADFESYAYDPGSYYGATYTSSYSSLYVDLAFSQPLSSITQSVKNESPYENVEMISSFPAQGFTTASFTRLLRSIKQYTPIVGSTIYTNKKVTVASPPIFDEQFIEIGGTKVLTSYTSIKRLEEKVYNSGQNIVYFAVSPTDFINQNIIRSMGVIDVNNIIGSPRFIKNTSYPVLQNIQKDYIELFNETVQPNDYIRFFKDLTQGPSEMADEMVPARAKLLDGIVIESPILSRNKDYLVRSVAADGTATKKFNNYVSGSGSIGIGAYDFDELVEDMVVLPNTFGDILPITGEIDVPEVIQFKSSTNPKKAPGFRNVRQKVNPNTKDGFYNPYATASIMDHNSAFVSLEADAIDTGITLGTLSGAPARALYYGIPASGSIAQRFASEEGSVEPFYNIPPRGDLNDIGVVTYFHKSNGLYAYTVTTPYNQNFLVKLDTTVDDPLTRLNSKITLLSPTIIPNIPGRDEAFIVNLTYSPNTQSIRPLIVPNIFSIFGIIGPVGLRIRMYKTEAELTADRNRPITTIPSPSANVLFDGVLNGISQVFPYVLVQTENNIVYCNIENTTSADITGTITIEYFGYELNTLPRGYLPRHYKFSRDNTTALKRRNYLGCRDVNTTFDGESPVIVSLSTVNTIIVNSNNITTQDGNSSVNIPTTNTGIRLGGGGKLGIDGN